MNTAYAKATDMFVDGFYVVIRLGVHVYAASGTFLGWCNAEGEYMSLSRPESETLVTRIASKVLAARVA